MRVDQNQFFANQLSFTKSPGSQSSTDSFSAALNLNDSQPFPAVEDEEDAPVHGTITKSDIYERDHSFGDTTSSLLSELSKWAHMDPAEKIRAQWLGSHGMTEESFSQLPSDEQAAINKQIAEEVKRQLGHQPENDQVSLG